MAAGPAPFVRRAYDGSRHADRLSDMLRWRGDQAAQAAIRQGESSAQMWNNVGNIIGQTTQVIARDRAERPQRERERLEQERAEKLQTVLAEVGSLPPEQAIQRVRAAGFAAEANTLQKQYDDQILNRLQRENTTLDLASKRISQARTMFEEIQAAPEAERPAIYQQIAPRVRELVGPDLGSRVKDEYDPQFIERAMTWGLSTVERLNVRKAAVGLISEETANADERDDKARQALIQYLPTVDTPEEWTQAMQMAKARGARSETLALFPAEYSPDAVARVNEMGLTSEQRAKRHEEPAPESERAFIERAAREQGRPVASFNNNEIGRLKARFASLSRAPKESSADPTRFQSQSVVGADGKAVLANFDPRTGTYTTPDGQPIANPRPATTREQSSTGVQKRALNFFNRGKQADEELEALEPEIQQMGLGAQTYQALAPNFAQTQTGQSYQQAQRAFTEARLRKDSGAAIPDNEYKNDRQTYFAQPGDSPQTLEQKRRARAGILASLALESGAALTEMFGDDAPTILQTYKERSARPGTTGRPPLDVDTSSLPPAAPVAPAPPVAGMVRVKGPDNKLYDIPQSELQKALAAGATRVP